MKDCENCANKKSDVCCNCITAYVNDERQDPSHWVLLPQTNADRIRSMTDEELAEFLYAVDIREGATDTGGWLDFIKQPYGGDT